MQISTGARLLWWCLCLTGLALSGAALSGSPAVAAQGLPGVFAPSSSRGDLFSDLDSPVAVPKSTELTTYPAQNTRSFEVRATHGFRIAIYDTGNAVLLEARSRNGRR